MVVGNVGMRDRTEFLLGSVPNRVSHNARCSVVIVNTAMADAPDGTAPRRAGAEPTEGQLLAVRRMSPGSLPNTGWKMS